MVFFRKSELRSSVVEITSCVYTIAIFFSISVNSGLNIYQTSKNNIVDCSGYLWSCVYVVSQGIDQFDDIGPSVVMASPGMMQVCSFTCARCKVCYMIG